jgi:SAM-dependent methyltransferase
VSILWDNSAATFGSGGSEPYARALRDGESEQLYLQELRGDAQPMTAEIDASRWNGAASDADLRLLQSVRGPVLDVGCGPGRMVRAAMDLGMDALGVDVSLAAVEVARRSGIRVLHRSVFDELPLEGAWQSVLLVDENIGIGGNVNALLARCQQLIAANGEIVVELHPDNDRDRAYTGRLVDGNGEGSATFPWAEIGITALLGRARTVGLELRQSWTEDDRSFARLVNRRR